MNETYNINHIVESFCCLCDYAVDIGFIPKGDVLSCPDNCKLKQDFILKLTTNQDPKPSYWGYTER